MIDTLKTSPSGEEMDKFIKEHQGEIDHLIATDPSFERYRETKSLTDAEIEANIDTSGVDPGEPALPDAPPGR